MGLFVDPEPDLKFCAAEGAMIPIHQFSLALRVVRLRSSEPQERLAQLKEPFEERCLLSNVVLDAGDCARSGLVYRAGPLKRRS